MATATQNTTDSPASLVAIVRAARLAGDRDLERVARQELRSRFGMDVTFTRASESKGGQGPTK